MSKQNCESRVVYVIDGARTPFLKAQGKPGPFSAADLAVAAGRVLLARMPFSPSELDEIITGCVMPSIDEANISRIIAMRLGCGKAVPAWTVQRNCASGLQAIDNAVMDIAIGRYNLVLAGGTEAMSHAPLLFNKNMVNWLTNWMSSKSITQKARTLAQLRPTFFAPVIALLKGLTDPLNGYSMGHTAEKLAYQFGISRQEMDEFAVLSHQRAINAQENNLFSEIITLYDNKGNYYQDDNGARSDSNVEKLAKLKPFFDKKFGSVTAANSSQITDGAAFVLLASEEAVKRYQLPVLGKVTDMTWVGVEPTEMGIGPVHAIAKLLQKRNLSLNDVDYYEINEAFAGQVLACLKAWEDEDYCKKELGLDKPLGTLNLEKLNVDGGAIALGHPVGASGARILLHLLHTLKRNNAKRGIASLCIGGGQGGAMLVERVTEEEQHG